VDFLWKWLGGKPIMGERSGILGPRQSPSRAFGKTFWLDELRWPAGAKRFDVGG
jgi:hypothetical protein